MSREKVDEFNKKIGRQEVRECPNCKKPTDHTFCRKGLSYFSSDSYLWYWECDKCRKTQEIFRY